MPCVILIRGVQSSNVCFQEKSTSPSKLSVDVLCDFQRCDPALNPHALAAVSKVVLEITQSRYYSFHHRVERIDRESLDNMTLCTVLHAAPFPRRLLTNCLRQPGRVGFSPELN